MSCLGRFFSVRGIPRHFRARSLQPLALKCKDHPWEVKFPQIWHLTDRQYHSPQNLYKWIPLPIFLCIFFVIFTGFRGGHRFFCKRKQQSESTDIARPMWCFLFLWGRGAGKNFLWHFYEINSSQDFFVLQKKLGVDGNVTVFGCPGWSGGWIEEYFRFLRLL